MVCANSHAMFIVDRWDNAEREFLSPWDLEPIDDTRKSSYYQPLSA